MENVSIRQAGSGDIDKLQAISRQTFFETFSEGNSEENMNKYLGESFSTGKLAAELNDRNVSFYFAELEDRVIGYLKVNTGSSQTELKDEQAVEIERIYVLKEYQGMKLGQLLYEKAEEIARQAGAGYIWLGVWEENPRAIAFYKKNGFVEFDRHIFRLGDDEQTDIMMRLNLVNRDT